MLVFAWEVTYVITLHTNITTENDSYVVAYLATYWLCQYANRHIDYEVHLKRFEQLEVKWQSTDLTIYVPGISPIPQLRQVKLVGIYYLESRYCKSCTMYNYLYSYIRKHTLAENYWVPWLRREQIESYNYILHGY